MRRAAAFLVPASRPAVLVLLVVLWVSAVMVVAVLHVDRPIQAVDAIVLAALLLPGVAGHLAGFVVQDLQHTTFAWQLPHIRRSLMAGFVLVGVLWTALNLAFILPHRSGHHPLALFAAGVAAYCFAAALRDPLSRPRSLLHVALALVLLSSSQPMGQASASQPMLVIAGAVVLAAASLARLFATSTFRRKPYLPTSSLPGAFMYATTRRYEREKLARLRATGRGWRGGVLGTSTRGWLLATIHESRSWAGWRGLMKLQRGMPAVLAVFALHAMADTGDGGFLAALARTFFDAVLRSPHVAPLGEQPPYVMVPLMVSALGVALVVLEPLTLSSSLLYPLSRRGLARVTFAACVVDSAMFTVAITATLLPLALLCGAALGVPLRFDFMPAVLRAVLLTLWLRPLAQWYRLRTPPGELQRSEMFLFAFTFGIVAAIILVGGGCSISAALFPSTSAELLVLCAGVALAHIVLRRAFANHFAVADLV